MRTNISNNTLLDNYDVCGVYYDCEDYTYIYYIPNAVNVDSRYVTPYAGSAFYISDLPDVDTDISDPRLSNYMSDNMLDILVSGLEDHEGFIIAGECILYLASDDTIDEIDLNHFTETMSRNLTAWLPKIRSGKESAFKLYITETALYTDLGNYSLDTEFER